jgi:hypothetical protein
VFSRLGAPVLVVCFLACYLPGCGSKAQRPTIGEILADPARFHEQVLEIEGEATDSFGLFSAGVFGFKDATGEINVITSAGLPAAGSKFTVRGTVITGVTVAGKRYGTAIQEQKRAYPE